MSETFSILSLKEMKLHAGSSAAAAGGAAGEDEEEGSIGTMTKKVLQAAQKKVVQQVSGGRRAVSVDRWRSRSSRPLLLVVHRSTRRSS